MKRVPIILSLCLALLYCIPFFTSNTAFAIGPQTDLGISIQSSAKPVTAGTSTDYQVTTTNTQGPAQAVNVVTTLTLPVGVNYVSVAPTTNCVYENRVVTCTWPTLDVGKSTFFTVTAAIAPDARGTLQISGATKSNIEDPKQDNNNRIVSTVVQPDIDLQISQESVSPNPAIAGAPLVYQYRVNNAGLSTATNTILEMTFPANTLDALLSATAGIPCAKTSATLISCNLGTVAPTGVTHEGWLPSGSVISVEIKPLSALAAGSNLSISASLDGDELEAKTSNNFVYTITPVARLSDLDLKLEAMAERVSSNTDVTYSFIVKNHGPSDSDTVVFSGSFAKDAFVVKDTPAPNCTVKAGEMSCALGTMTVGQEIKIAVTGRVLSGQSMKLEFPVKVQGASPEPEGGAANTLVANLQVQPFQSILPFVNR